MQDMNLTSLFVELTSRLGLNYEFLLTGYEAQIWRDGFLTTIYLVAVTIPVSLFFGVIFAACLTSGRSWLSTPVRAFVELTRNTPTLVQLMFSFLVLNTVVSNMVGGAANNPLSPFFWVVAVVGLHVAALHAEAIRGGIEAVPASMIEAARGMGFSQFEVLRYVQIPLALRSSLPAIINGLISLVKSTTVGNAIAVSEITYASIMVWTQRDNVVELMIVLLAFFSLINFLIARLGTWVERKLAVPGYGL